MTKREFDPIIGEHPDRNKIQCSTCKKRLKIIIAGKDIGSANAYCEEYTKEDMNGKPIGILFKNEKCEFYEAE